MTTIVHIKPLSIHRPIVVAAISIIATLAAHAEQSQPVRVLTLDESRTTNCVIGSNFLNFNILTGNAFQIVVGDLLDPANFGASGVVDRPIKFLPQVDEISVETLADADVVLLSLINPAVPLTNCELDRLAQFIAHGGGVFVFANPAAAWLGERLGGSSKSPVGNSSTATFQSNPVTEGPFGAAVGSIGINFHQVFTDIGPYGSAFLMSNAPVAASYEYGDGRAVLFNDEEWASQVTLSGCGAGNIPSTIRQTVFKNSVACIIPDPGFTFDHPPCPADITRDCNVGVADLLALLSEWGRCGDPASCPADLTGDSNVGVPDLLFLLGAWGPCPK